MTTREKNGDERTFSKMVLPELSTGIYKIFIAIPSVIRECKRIKVEVVLTLALFLLLLPKPARIKRVPIPTLQLWSRLFNLQLRGAIHFCQPQYVPIRKCVPCPG